MPLDPHNWALKDYPSATILDGDHYLWSGEIFTANGIRFHARRPLYKSYNADSGNSLSNNSWGLAYGNSSNTTPASNVIVDTPGLLGAWFDPRQSGSIQLNLLAGGGGLSNLPGGLMLGTEYCLWPSSGGSGSFGAGIGNRANPSSAPASQGTFQPANSSHENCAICIDLLDSNLNQWAPFGYNGSGGSAAPVGTTNADGSGWASRWMAHWASVYPANGFTVTASPNPVTNWTSSSAITSTLLNGRTGLRDVLRYLNMPPLARAAATGSQSLTANTAAMLNLTATTGMISYSGSFGSNTFTAPFNGLYFVHGYAGINNIAGTFKVGVQINGGTTYWGPICAGAGSGNPAASKTQIFSLNKGDTVTLQALATNNTTTTTGNPARLVVLWVSNRGVPAISPNPPDTSFRWTAGTQAPVASLWNNYIANDLTFLTYRPYLMSYQTVGQNVSPSTPTGVTMDTVGGIVHGDNGDNYGGWSSHNNYYSAPVDGWYMVVGEYFFQPASLTSTPSVLALAGLNPHGSDQYDRYQQQNMVGSADGSGATIVSYYYLRGPRIQGNFIFPGDTITPAVETYDSTSSTIQTSTITNSHFELVWLGE